MRLQCPLCEREQETVFVSQYKNANKLFAGKSLFECQTCKLVFVSPMPSEKELDEYYKTVWLKDENIVSTSSDTELVYQIQARERVKYLSKHIALSNISSVLDVGSGFGYLYDAFNDMFPGRIDFYATDSSPEALKKLKSKGIKAFMDISELGEKKFDLVCACFVLEHVNKPKEFMNKIAGRVKKDGYVFVTVPERDDTFKEQLEPHVTAYNEQSLKSLAEAVGLETVHFTGCGRERSKLIREKRYINRILNLPARLFNKIRRLFVKDMLKWKTKTLYGYYKFDKEGRQRWWIRAILIKR